MVYGSAPSSKACGDAQELSFKQWGAANGLELDFYDSSLAFGFNPEALGPTIDRLKADNVDMLFTCMDVAANLRILTAIQDAGLKTAMYWPNGYDQDYLNEFGDQIKNYVVTGSFFRPFEVAPSPGMKSYQATMTANKLKISELTLTGWINADLLVTGHPGGGGHRRHLRPEEGRRRHQRPDLQRGRHPAGVRCGRTSTRARRARSTATPTRRSTGPRRSSSPWPPTSPSRGSASTATRRSSPTRPSARPTSVCRPRRSRAPRPTAPAATAAQPDDPAKATADIMALADGVRERPDASTPASATIANGDSIATVRHRRLQRGHR